MDQNTGRRKNQLRARKQESQSGGGREFGNVIEPMQAQMASGNKGLAADVGSESQAKKPSRRKKAA